MAVIRIGISGWQYKPWRGLFYPKDLPQRAELEYAATALPTIEINGSFYSLQRPESYAKWYAHTPPEFVFTIKGPRYITHMRRLRDVVEPLANFFASGLFNLKEKLGAVLWQCPPGFKYDRERMETFFKQLPADLDSARALAQNHSEWMKGRVALDVVENRRLRHAIEIRDDSFLDPSFIELLTQYGVAIVIAETARTWPMIEDITADFVYMRLHGDKQLYQGGYSDKSLDGWASRIRAWHEGSEPPDAKKIVSTRTPNAVARDIYCFFDNTDVKLRAPFDSQTLLRKLGATYTPSPIAIGASETADQERKAASPRTPRTPRKKAAKASKRKKTPARATKKTKS